MIELTSDIMGALLADATRDGIQKVVVGAVIVHPMSRSILVVQRAQDDFMGGLKELPSGGVDPDEALDQALRREVDEETGLCLSEAVFVLSSFDYVSGSGKKARQLNFLARATHEAFSLNPGEHDDGWWIEPTEETIKALGLSLETERVVLEGVSALDSLGWN